VIRNGPGRAWNPTGRAGPDGTVLQARLIKHKILKRGQMVTDSIQAIIFKEEEELEKYYAISITQVKKVVSINV